MRCSSMLLFALLGVLLSALGCSAVPKLPRDATESTYEVQPGDVLNLTLYGEDLKPWFGEYTFKKEETVRTDGSIAIPFLGDRTVQGLTPARIASRIEHELRESFPRGLVHALVIPKRINSRAVHVYGEVVKPGRYNFPGNLGVLDAIALAGGLHERASGDVMVVRPGLGIRAETGEVDLNPIILKGDTSGDFPVLAGDILIAERSVAAVIEDFVSKIFSPFRGLLEGIFKLLSAAPIP